MTYEVALNGHEPMNIDARDMKRAIEVYRKRCNIEKAEGFFRVTPLDGFPHLFRATNN